MIHQLDKIFKPKSIAVVGASTKEKSVGHSIFKNLVDNNSKAMYIPSTPKLVNYWATKHILPWLTCLKK